jgi:hypothetical protein
MLAILRFLTICAIKSILPAVCMACIGGDGYGRLHFLRSDVLKKFLPLVESKSSGLVGTGRRVCCFSFLFCADKTMNFTEKEMPHGRTK